MESPSPAEHPPAPFDYAAALAPDFELVAGPVEPRSDPFRGVSPDELARTVAELSELNRASAPRRSPPSKPD